MTHLKIKRTLAKIAYWGESYFVIFIHCYWDVKWNRKKGRGKWHLWELCEMPKNILELKLGWKDCLGDLGVIMRIKFWDLGPCSVVGIATAYGLDGPGIESRWGEIFRTIPDRPWGPPSLLYNWYRVFPGGKVLPGRDADPSPPSSAEV